MRFRFTHHARDRRLYWSVTMTEIHQLLETAPTRGETADQYTRRFDDRLLRLHVVRDSDPPLIITVYEVR